MNLLVESSSETTQILKVRSTTAILLLPYILVYICYVGVIINSIPFHFQKCSSCMVNYRVTLMLYVGSVLVGFGESRDCYNQQLSKEEILI